MTYSFVSHKPGEGFIDSEKNLTLLDSSVIGSSRKRRGSRAHEPARIVRRCARRRTKDYNMYYSYTRIVRTYYVYFILIRRTAVITAGHDQSLSMLMSVPRRCAET